MNRVAVFLPLLALAACSQNSPDEAEPATLHEIMTAEIDEPADALWDVSNAAIGDEAGIDPALMDDERWEQIAVLAERVAAGAQRIAALDPIVVTRDGVEVADADIEGGHSAAQVQAAVDANPELLRELAESLGTHVTELAAAARAHDAARAGPLIDQLDGVCETCHLNFWYPEQKDLVEQFQNEGLVDPDHPALGPSESGE